MATDTTVSHSTVEAPPVAILLLGTVHASYEADGHAIELAFDHDQGPGATHWKAGKPGVQTITVDLVQPCTVKEVSMEVEEREVARAQEVQLAVSSDNGQTYRECVRQEFNFSPDGATWEKETWYLSQHQVTNVRLVIKPDKGRQDVYATLTAFELRGFYESASPKAG